MKVRRGIISELEFSYDISEYNAKGDRAPHPDGYIRIPLKNQYPIHEANLLQIGLLSVEEAAAVFKAYAYLYNLPWQLTFIGTVDRKHDPVISIQISADRYDGYTEISSNLHRHTNEAVVILKKHLRETKRRFPAD